MKYLPLILLAACSELPKEVVDGGEKLVRAHDTPPAVTAGCMARAVESFNINYTTSIRPTEKGQEAVIRIPSLGRTIAVVQLDPQPKGTLSTIWITPNAFIGREKFTAAITKGC